MRVPRLWVAAAAAALLALIVAIAIAVDDAERPSGSATVTAPTPAPAVPVNVAVDGPDANAKPDTPITLDREAREIVQNAQKTPEQFDMAGDLRGKDDTPVAQHEGPLATPNFPGCTTRILPTNWSNRTAPVRAIGLHYTAGANRAGLSDMNGLTGYASSPSAGVSWHFLIDAEGHCYYSVPLQKKAWTIGNLNSQTVNIEVIGRGNEPSYPAAPAGARKLRQVVQRLGRVYGIPMRVGAVSNCNVTRSGVITHWQGGGCSGGHIDIKPYAIERVVATFAVKPVTSVDRVTCRKLNWWRTHGRRHGLPERRAIRRRQALERRGVTCLSGGPVRR